MSALAWALVLGVAMVAVLVAASGAEWGVESELASGAEWGVE